MALRFRGLDHPIEVQYYKDSGGAPQPVDPYTQAAAQYGLSTGTARYNAGIDRTNQVNPLGSSSWSVYDPPQAGYSGPAAISGTATTPQSTSVAPSQHSVSSNPNPLSAAALGGSGGTNYSGISIPGLSGTTGIYGLGAAPPTYTETTQLTPWAQQALQSPIDTRGIAGMPGGPSTTQDLSDTRDAQYRQQMSFLKPEQDIQSEAMDSRLANEGATVGSPAWNNEQDRLGREQELARSNARDSAISAGGAEQSRLFGLGSQSLQNQIAVRNAPISEYNALTGAPGANATALTPDISGAFGQQYQGQLAGYNAGVASDNATTSTVGSLAAVAAMYFL